MPMREAASGEGEAMKLVVFDCDGTIVDSQHGILCAEVIHPDSMIVTPV